MAEVYPFLDELASVWKIFLRLVDRTHEHLEDYPAFQTPARDDAIEETLSEYKDLLIHIHYLQLLVLFHSASQCFIGNLEKDPQWKQCYLAIEENAKEL
ncbi:hypothetical protein C0995_003547, partial [Termitomyces sp. Mi166